MRLGRIARWTTTALVALATCAPMASADGQLDPSFGSAGRVDLNLATSSGVEGASTVIPVGGGSVLAVGGGEGKGVWVTRTLANGSLDGSYGTGGGSFFPQSKYSFAAGAVREANGSLVLAGGEISTMFDTFLARLTPQGALDPTFGNDPPHPSGDGVSLYDLGEDDIAEGVVIDSTGGIVVAGRTGPGGNHDVLLARFNSDGSIDSSFGGPTGVHTNLGGDDQAHAVAMQGDRIIVLARSGVSTDVLGYRPDGTLDPSFGGGDGIAPVNFPSTGEAHGLLVQPDGGIVVVGNETNHALIARLQPDGSPDIGFGSGGVTSLAVPAPATETYVRAVARSDDGKIIAVGTAYTPGSPSRVVLFRTLANGQPDPSWGTGGALMIPPSEAEASESGFAIAVEPDRRIVVGGDTFANANDDRLLLRVLGDTTPPDTVITSAPQPRTRTPLSLATLSFEAAGDVHTTFECELTSPTPSTPVRRHRKHHHKRRHHHHHRRHHRGAARASATTGAATTTTGFAPCASPVSYANLSTPGTYTFAVRAIDPAGNVDPTPATAGFTVLETPPHKHHRKHHHHRRHHRHHKHP